MQNSLIFIFKSFITSDTSDLNYTVVICYLNGKIKIYLIIFTEVVMETTKKFNTFSNEVNDIYIL